MNNGEERSPEEEIKEAPVPYGLPEAGAEEEMPKPFRATGIEKIMAFLFIPITFFYVHLFFQYYHEKVYLTLFAVLFLLAAELFYRKRKRSVESVLYLICTVLVLLGYTIGGARIWETAYQFFFLHLFAVYYVLCRSGRLLEGRTGSMVVLDGTRGFFVLPFKNYILQIRTIVAAISDRKHKKSPEQLRKIPVIVIALIAGLLLLRGAVMLLSAADAVYAVLMSKMTEMLRVDWNPATFILELLLLSMVSPYLYGLFGGLFREPAEVPCEKSGKIRMILEKCRKVPNIVWVLLIAFFTVFYALFFYVQARVLLSTFLLQLPEGLTYARNAHVGFGYMCGVNLINFALLYLTSRSAEKKNGGLKAALSLMTLENMLFTVIAFLKIYIYIHTFGFTPLRLKSIWLAAVLFYAGVCILVHIFTEKKTMRAWFIGSAVSLAVMCVF